MRSLCRTLPVVALLLAGCDDDSMTVQPKNKPLTPSVVWADGTSARPLPEGTVALTDLDRDHAVAVPPPVTPALLQRGQERFDIYCTPCHGYGGHGDGMIVQRGFPPPPDYASPRLRAADAAHLFDVITNGWGVMYGYAARVEPGDRWAIIAYIRALQVAAAVPADRILAAGEKRP